MENEPCSDSCQIRDLELEHDSSDILIFSVILSLVILIKGILIKNKRCRIYLVTILKKRKSERETKMIG